MAIDQVPAACAALWSPYQVTKVPPPDILQQEHVPAAPPVRNMTSGAVSDATAQHWAEADIADAGWLKWAEANDELAFLIYVNGPDVLSAAERMALAQGALITQPDCDLYPAQRALFGVGADGNAYFMRKGLPTDNTNVFVEVFTGPCSVTATFPDGHTATIAELPQTTTAFVPGKLKTDPVLGDIWYSDAGGGCQDPAGPPSAWCAP